LHESLEVEEQSRRDLQEAATVLAFYCGANEVALRACGDAGRDLLCL
jgi:hypothetical protein